MKKFESGWQKRPRKRESEEAGKQRRCNIGQLPNQHTSIGPTLDQCQTNH